MKTGQYAQHKSASQKSRQQDPNTKFALVCTKYALCCASRREIRYVPRAVDRNPQVPPTGNAPANWCLKKCCHCETSAHTGRGNPPVRAEMFRKLPR